MNTEDFIEDFFHWLGRKLPFLDMSNYGEVCTNAVHVLVGCWWALFWSHFVRLSPWFWFSLPVFLGYILWREFLFDEHLKRLRLGTETAQGKKDLSADLFTKLIGLVFYGFGFLP